MEIITGGVTAAKGFMAAGVEAGIKYQNRKDMAMVYSKTPCRAAGVFTTNVVKAAPVLWDKEVVESEWEAQAIVVNSGIANACTGKLGYEYCRETAGAAADALEISPQSVLICSTGVIGMQLPMEKMTEGVRMLAKAIKPGEEAGTDAAKAIMTTDYPQQAGCSKGDDWWKRSNHRRHVQRLRYDSSEYVHNARICDNGCEYLQKASAGSTER